MKINKGIFDMITSKEYVEDAYKSCPCWSIIPGKSRNCLDHCPQIQRDMCTAEFEKSKNNK